MKIKFFELAKGLNPKSVKLKHQHSKYILLWQKEMIKIILVQSFIPFKASTELFLRKKERG